MNHIDNSASHTVWVRRFSALTALVVLTAFGPGRAAADDDHHHHHHHTTFGFITASASSGLYMVDMSTNKAVAQIPKDGPLQTVTAPDGKTTFSVKTSENEVLMTDGDSDDPDRIRVGEGPSGLALSLDGKKVFVFNSVEHTISVIDIEDEAVEEVDPLPAFNFGITVTPDGQLSAVN